MTAQRQSEKLLVEDKDTFVCIPFMRAKILFGEIAELSEYKRTADSSLAVKDTMIENGKLNEQELKQGIGRLQDVNGENEIQITTLKNEMKTTKKIWRRRFLVGSGTGVLLGTIFGVLIAK